MKNKKGLIYTILLLFLIGSVLIVRKFMEPKVKFEQTIIVEDDYLNDLNIFNDDYTSINGIQNYSAKKLFCEQTTTVSDDYEKSFFYHETQIRQAVRYRLIPKKNSDYIVTIPKMNGLHVEVLKQNLLRYNTKISALEVLEKEEGKIQYCYNLEEDDTYYIYVINDDENEIKCNIVIEQNNWIYAPLGGYAEYGSKRVSYLSQMLLIEGLRVFLATFGDYDFSTPDYEVQTMCEEDQQLYAARFIELIDYMVETQNEDAKDFIKNYRSVDKVDLTQDLILSKFNIKFTTSHSGLLYSFNYGEWNQHNYFSKYLDNKRASKYIVFSSIHDKDAIIND